MTDTVKLMWEQVEKARADGTFSTAREDSMMTNLERLADRLAGHLGPFNFITNDERDMTVAALRAAALTPQGRDTGREPSAWLYEMAFYIKPSDDNPLREWKTVVTLTPPPTIPKDGVRNVQPLFASLSPVERGEGTKAGATDARPAQEPVAWQPIDTAPKDGTHILARRVPIGIRFTNNTNPPTVVHWFDDPDQPGFYTSVNELAPEHPFNPTHWMPLPLTGDTDDQTLKSAEGKS